MANIIVSPNPFNPNDRMIEAVESAITIQGWLAQHAARVGLAGTAFIALVNGAPVMRGSWAVRNIGINDTLAFAVLPAGGGGGKNPLATIASLALMIAAPALATSTTFGFGLAAGSFAANAATIGISLAGSLLIGALFSPPTPNLPEFGTAPRASPTYALSARGNQARLGQPIPVIYGNHKIYPDLAAAPWTSYTNNEQYLHQLHMIGQGEYDIQSINIDDTPIANFAEITHQIIAPGGAITLFEPDYVTAPEVSGQQLYANQTIGGFVVNPADTTTTEIQIDIVAAGGLYYANTDGSLGSRSVSWRVEARPIDNDGVATSGWSTLGNETLAAATNTAQRRTYIYSVSSSRYQVRVTRTTTDSANVRVRDTINWEAARAKLGRTTNTSGVTMLAIRARATNNLSQRNRGLISCIVQRKLPIWNGTAWSAPTATRSIAWAIADIARAAYGGKMLDKRIDLAAFLALDAVWAARTDYFDAVFDTPITVWQALNRVAQCGRGGCYMQGGVLRITRDSLQTLPVAMFTPRNIVKGSLKTDYRLADDDTASAVTVQFHNRRSWTNDTTTQSVDGDTSNPASLTMFGITEEAQAIREAAYHTRANRYRRKAITFTTEMEGFMVAYGDLIRIIHQQPNWGIGGEVIAYDAASRTVTLSEPPVWGDANTGHILLRAPTGGVLGAWEVTKGGADNQVILPEGVTPSISTGGDREATHFGFGLTASTIGITARVVGIKPRAQSKVEITAMAEDDRVHVE